MGSYIFTMDCVEERVNEQSPISGTYSYAYDGEHWLSVMDGHDMRGLVARDLWRYYYGCYTCFYIELMVGATESLQ